MCFGAVCAVVRCCAAAAADGGGGGDEDEADMWWECDWEADVWWACDWEDAHAAEEAAVGVGVGVGGNETRLVVERPATLVSERCAARRRKSSSCRLRED